jgi:predicted RNase H-like HicB family nuclease
MDERSLEAAVERYMRLPYLMVVFWDDGYWAAEFPELPGLAAGHEDRLAMREVVDDAKRTYFEEAIRQGKAIPEPRPDQLRLWRTGRLVGRRSKGRRPTVRPVQEKSDA